MKEFIGQIIQKLEAIFLPKRVKQVDTGMKRTNGSARKLQRFLSQQFEFRYNRLTGVTEYHPKETDTDFRPIDEREMNGMIVDARLKGIACWNSMVPTLVLSNKVESYNPFQDYLGKLPTWDGIDRVTPFLQRVSDDERRFICVEVTRMIPEEPIEYEQLYVQLKQEVLSGERDYLNKEEEKEVQRRNKAYYRQSPLEDVFHACYRHPEPDEEGNWLTASEIFRLMNKCNASALRGISAKQLSYRLTAMGFSPKHTMRGNCYHVVLKFS